MTLGRLKRYRPGQTIAGDLTVLGVIAQIRGRHPIYLCWSHRRWCPLAVKIFRDEVRARREFEVLQAVSHPNVLKVYDVLPPHAMTMEVLEGHTLEMELHKSPSGHLGIADSLRAMVHVGAALQHIHQTGFLHLDLKPANIMMQHGRPILIDFGTARRLDDGRPSSAMGTPDYMSPEELAGGRVTPASDVYAFAVTAFELLTGRLPFAAGRRTGVAAAKPLNLRSLRPRAPKGLETILLAAMKPDPADRPTLNLMLPAMADLIRSGQPMWPPGFQPASALG
ncbi:MAG: hypothetical protein CGW95_02555 [Phenylobacterium zucineum]|nr:MAG: hypothetical protein CGW95_02555 [Phenylobacterium zucineum]